MNILITTTNTVEAFPVREYFGIVSGEAVIGANVVKDFLSSVTDFVGGRSGTMEKAFRQAREAALEEMSRKASAMGADAVIGVDIDCQVLGAKNGMVMAMATGTAVKLR